MYRYQPLPAIAERGATPPYTRVLYLEPGTGEDEPFCGRLEVINVESAPPFEALSYTWGAPGPTNYIWINGDPLPLGANLEKALVWLRLRNEVRCLWIDALCIDQSNVDERSRQVQYMRLVYQYCSRVVVWLGSKTAGVDLAFKSARRLSDIAKLTQEASAQSAGNAGERIDEETINDMIDNTLTGLPSNSLQCLNELFNREYFCRSWVVQEVMVGTGPLAKCEELEASFLDLVSILLFLGNRRQEIKVAVYLDVWYHVYSATQPDSIIRMTDVKGSLGPIVDVLEQMRDFKATDPRDKVYAVIGVCDEGIHPIMSLTHITRSSDRVLSPLHRAITGIQNYVNKLAPEFQVGIPDALIPNYNKDVATVYTDLARYLIKKTPMVLDVLSYVQHQKEPEPNSEYPSWVPKWFESRTYQKFRGMGNYQAGFCKTPVLSNLLQSQTMRALAHPRHLVLEGFQVGIVDKVSDALQFGRSGEEKTGAILGAWLQLFSFPMVPRPNYTYRTGGPLDAAFCKAITAGPTGMRFGSLLVEWGQGFQMGTPSFDPEVFEMESQRRISNFLSDLAHQHGVGPSPIEGNQQFSQDITAFRNAFAMFCYNRRVFLTREGHIGIGPTIMQPGDEIVVLYRGRMPYVVRRRPDHHVFIGDSYVADDDIMYGRVTDNVRHGRGGPEAMLYEIR